MAETKKPVGRPKKTAVDNPLSQNELYDVLNFAKTYYSTLTSGVYTPNLTNQRLSEITLVPKDMTEAELAEAIKDPVNNQDRLIGYSEWLQFSESVSKRTLGYMGNLLSFNPAISCCNIEKDSDYHSKEYKRDYAIVKDFFTRFDCKSQFLSIHRRTMVDDSYYGVFRTDGDKYEFQELPHKYCKITGRNAQWGFLFDFDMNWFLRMGLSLDQYPNIFKKMYNEIFDSKGMEDYNPANKLTQRNGTWSLWTQTSPLPREGNFACFKFNSDMYASIPFLTPLFADASNKNLIRRLQNDQYMIASQKLLIGLIPLLKEQKSGQVKDAFAVDPTTMGRFLGVLAQGLANNINVKPVPFSDVKDIAFDLPEHNMYDSYSKSLGSNSGVTSRLMYATDRQSSMETLLSSEIDGFICKQTYPQYGRWVTSMVNSLTEKFKFKITFSGLEFSSDKKEQFEKAQKMSTIGLTDFQLYANALGMNIFEFEERITSSSFSPLWKKMKLTLNSNTKYTGEEDKGGRPQADVPSDSTDRNLDRVQMSDGEEY